jgi:hypothetical protein
VGLQRYRCRECRKIFYQPLGPGQEYAIKRRREGEAEGDTKLEITLNSWQRKLLEGAFFVLMVIVFFEALKAISIWSYQIKR